MTNANLHDVVRIKNMAQATTTAVQRLPRGMMGSQPSLDALARGNRALVLAQQLAGWAAGHQEAFEIEARLEASAKQTAEAAAKPNFGFGGSASAA
jgi:hypothetical protein